MDGKVLDFIKENVTKRTGLFVGIVLVVVSLVLPIETLLKSLDLQIIYRVIIHLISVGSWVFFWWWHRNSFPRIRNGRIGLIISIRTENDKQKIRVKNDFKANLQELVKNKGLDQNLEILILSQHQTDELINVIDDGGLNDSNKGWNRIKEKLNGRFFIYGDIKERIDEHNKYFLKLQAAVLHAPLPPDIQQHLRADFDSVWFSKIDFYEKLEFKGFEVSAELAFIASTYITGLAALFSRDPFIAFKLHKDLLDEFSKFKPLPPNLQKIKDKLPLLLSDECHFIARWYYENKGDLINSAKFLKDSLTYFEYNYGALLLKSIIEFLDERNPVKALNTLKMAKQHSNNDGTWRYNEAFLLMYLEKFDEAIKLYNAIEKKTFKEEHTILAQVFMFNNSQIKVDPKFYQSWFILGFLKLKKEKNYPEALEYFDIFLQNAEGIRKYKPLIESARNHKNFLMKEMNLNKSN